MTIRPATLSDVESMMALARSSTSASQWSREQYESLVLDHGTSRLALIAESPNQADALSGFLIAHHVAPEWELENILVARDFRRNGIGKLLLDSLIAAALETDSRAVFLEVRESNAPARGLYERSGFEQSGRRKSYYSNPIEDAILYRRALHQPISS